MPSNSRTQLEQYLATIELSPDHRVLDIGGSQLPVIDRIAKAGCNEYKILDIAEPHELKREPDIVAAIDRPLHASVLTQYEKHFNLAFCLEVAEYFRDPWLALHNINRLVMNGGSLIISFPFVYPTHNPVDCDYFRYTEQGAAMLLEESGFEITKTIHRVGPSLLRAYSDEKMRPSRDYTQHDSVAFIFETKKHENV